MKRQFIYPTPNIRKPQHKKALGNMHQACMTLTKENNNNNSEQISWHPLTCKGTPSGMRIKEQPCDPILHPLASSKTQVFLKKTTLASPRPEQAAPYSGCQAKSCLRLWLPENSPMSHSNCRGCGCKDPAAAHSCMRSLGRRDIRNKPKSF